MNSEPNYRKKKLQKINKWGFTFIGGTPERPEDELNRDKLARLVDQKQLVREQLFPLSTTEIGDRVVLAQILSGQNLEHRLSQMGLTLGSEVQIIIKTHSGSVVICIQDKQIGLGAGMANQVMVTLVAEQ